MTLPVLFKKKAEAITNAIPINTKTSNTQIINKIHEDPFFRENISSVNLHYYPNGGYNKPANGEIYFKAGNTGGSQRFEGQTIEEILEKMAEFIKTL